jgi:uncharacterized protein YecA (UPF0149 family)
VTEASVGIVREPITKPKTGVAASQIMRAAPKIGRNERCPCGSGKKYKKCGGA